MVSKEEAIANGAYAPSAIIILVLDTAARAPVTTWGNVRSAQHERLNRTIMCDGVVVDKPLIGGQEFILNESVAILLGFYNVGFDPGGRVMWSPAYGQPELFNSWAVRVAHTFRPYVNSSPAIVYETVVFDVVSQVAPINPQSQEN